VERLRRGEDKMCEETIQGLGYIQPEEKYCPDYESSECPKNCEIRKKLLGAKNILTISEMARIDLKNYMIRDFDNKCEKRKIKNV
jgi:hypothetical protein